MAAHVLLTPALSGRETGEEGGGDRAEHPTSVSDLRGATCAHVRTVPHQQHTHTQTHGFCLLNC